MFRYTGDPLKLEAVVATDDGDSTVIPMGTLRDGMTRRAPRCRPAPRRDPHRADLPPQPVHHRRPAPARAHDATIVFTGSTA